MEVANSKQGEKGKNKKWNRRFKFTSEEASKEAGESVELDGGVVGGDGDVANQGEESRILLVRTENLEHNPFEQTQELKVSESIHLAEQLMMSSIGHFC